MHSEWKRTLVDQIVLISQVCRSHDVDVARQHARIQVADLEDKRQFVLLVVGRVLRLGLDHESDGLRLA